MDVSLVMFKADGTRRDFPLDQGRVVLGRTKNCDLRVPLSSVSRQHCELIVDGDSISLRDLGSSNGTFHNNNRVQEATLEAGDEIMVGPVVFTVVIDGKPEDIEPVRTLIPGEDEDESSQVSMEESDQLTQLGEGEDDELEVVEPENHSPTVDLDDPIAALEALSEADDEDEDDDDVIKE